jgi:hypothetical protein
MKRSVLPSAGWDPYVLAGLSSELLPNFCCAKNVLESISERGSSEAAK